MMKMDQVAGSSNDEFYTPAYAIEPLIKHISNPSAERVWCPFDTEDSLFVKMLTDAGCTVVNTHLETGHDFFKIMNEYPEWVKQFTMIISNPPYSLKTEVFEKLFECGVPFAMLVGVVGLFESQKRFEMFRDNDWEIMYFNRRISYMRDYESGKTALNPPFSSAYVCHGMLPQKVVFEEINKKKVLP